MMNIKKRYIEKNKTALQLDKSSMKSLVLEIIDENEYDQKNYPFYKLLFMTTYPSVDSFKHELKKIPNYEKKYPLLNLSLIMENKCKYLIKYLPKFNSFINFMIDNYSYKISRVEASTMLIKDQEIYKNDVGGFKKMFNEFIQIWEKIKESATKFQCNPDMEPITLSEGNSLDYFLNDNAEIGKGMYIASALQNFVSWQNNFLDKLIDALKNGGILHHYLDNLKKTIDVQNAKQNDVLNFDEMEQKLIGQIFENSKRNIFKMENKVSYQNYRQFLYDFDSMERVLGKIILTGKVKFKSDKDFRFVTYNLEGFRGNKSSVFTDFIEQYQPIELTDQIKQKIYNCLKKKIKNKSKDLQRILFSIQLLIYYLTQEYRESHEEINIIIKQLPEYVKLTDECIHFFEEQKNIKVCELSAVYSFFEVLCFSTIESNLNDYYKQTINDDIKEKILKSFEQVGKINILLLKKTSLATACRRLISRYLVSTREDTDINEKNKLYDYIMLKEEFWSKEDWKNRELIQNDIEILRESDITLGQCYELYKLLGGDENEALKGIDLGNEDEEDDDDSDDEDEKIVRKKKEMKY